MSSRGESMQQLPMPCCEADCTISTEHCAVCTAKPPVAAPACGKRARAPSEGVSKSRWPAPPHESCRCPARLGRSAAEGHRQQQRMCGQRWSAWPADASSSSSRPLSLATPKAAAAVATAWPVHLRLCKAVAKAAWRQDVQLAAGGGGDDLGLPITVQVGLRGPNQVGAQGLEATA